MGLIKFAFGTVASIIALIVAAKIVAFVLGLIGIVLKLVWMIVILGAICLVGYVIYKMLTPGPAESV
jgi:hypothetical protein